MAKIVHLWVASDFAQHKILFSVEMVLNDDNVVYSCSRYSFALVFI